MLVEQGKRTALKQLEEQMGDRQRKVKDLGCCFILAGGVFEGDAIVFLGVETFINSPLERNSLESGTEQE